MTAAIAQGATCLSVLTTRDDPTSTALPFAPRPIAGHRVPIPGCEGKKKLTLGEVLRALDSGENLVEIDDEDATVRVWVE